MSRKDAIDRMCKACIYDKNGDGTWLQQVTACTDFRCSLFKVRPITSGKSDVKKLIKLEHKAEAYVAARKRRKAAIIREKVQLNNTKKGGDDDY